MKTLVVKKPWGQFEQFTHNEATTVKIISVSRGELLSLQTHANRSEFWKVLSGHPRVTIGELTKTANPGEEFFINKMEQHRLAGGEEDAQILEIAYGDFDENDIVRIEDNYGRA